MKSSLAKGTHLLSRKVTPTRRCLSISRTSPVFLTVRKEQPQWQKDRQTVLSSIAKSEELRNSMAYSLAMATQEGSILPSMTHEADERMIQQLLVSKNQLVRARPASSIQPETPLPRTLTDALRPSKQAIVVTETKKPFRICDVNKAWEGLCGYTHVESKGRSLGELLKGPETDPLATTAMLNQLLRGEEATLILTNYTKNGRRFRNRLRVGPLFDDQDGTTMTHFVGVLQEVSM